jgi:hypothetical protein
LNGNIKYIEHDEGDGHEHLAIDEHVWLSVTNAIFFSAAIGEKLDIPVAHAGLAFYEIYTSESSIDLYNPDLSHPSYAGSYLAAAALYTKIFGKAPEASIFCGDLILAEAEILCRAAENASKNVEIPSV